MDKRWYSHKDFATPHIHKISENYTKKMSHKEPIQECKKPKQRQFALKS